VGAEDPAGSPKPHDEHAHAPECIWWGQPGRRDETQSDEAGHIREEHARAKSIR